MQKVKKCNLSNFGPSVQKTKIEEALNFFKQSEKAKTRTKKKNKLEIARDNLIAWIKECKLVLYNALDKKKNNAYPKTVLDFYIIGRVLGKGAYGKVNLSYHKLSGKLVAIKSLHKQFLAMGHNQKKFKNEIYLLSILKHQSVIRLYETFMCDAYLLLVIELCSGGDLLSYVRKRRKLTEPVAKKAFKQVIDLFYNNNNK